MMTVWGSLWCQSRRRFPVRVQSDFHLWWLRRAPTRQLPAGVNSIKVLFQVSLLYWAELITTLVTSSKLITILWADTVLVFSSICLLYFLAIKLKVEMGSASAQWGKTKMPVAYLVDFWMNCRPNQTCKSAAVLDVFSRSSFCTIPALASVCSARDRQNRPSPDLTFSSFFPLT